MLPQHERTAPLNSIGTGPVHPQHPAATYAPISPFRRLLPFGIDEFFDVPLERTSHRRRPSKLFLQNKLALPARGDMLFDSAHLSLGEFLPGIPLQQFD